MLQSQQLNHFRKWNVCKGVRVFIWQFLLRLFFSIIGLFDGINPCWLSSRACLCAAESVTGGHSRVLTPSFHPVFVFSIIRSWMRLQSTGSESTSCPMPTPTRMRSSKSRPGSWRWARHPKQAPRSKPVFRPPFRRPSSWLSLTKCFCCRPAFPSPWLAPTNWLRWKERRSEGVCTPGEWWKWRTRNTMTSWNCAPCLCRYLNQWL